MASFEPNFITEPLPNAPSICASAASSAFCLSVLFTDFPDSTSDNCPAICRPFPALERQRKHRNARTMCHICSHGTRGEQNIISAFVIPAKAGISPSTPEDRKSVVEGKRVSVRVDLGGGRLFKKKKK